MGTILSQAEIDELLNSLSSGTEAEPEPEKGEEIQAKPYNFRTANRFPKEQIRTLNMVFQSFAQTFSTQMTGLLRTSCECEVFSIEEISFNEYNNSLPSPVILAVLSSVPLQGNQILQVSPEASYIVINRLLGGAHAGGETSKQFTEIELVLVERVLRQVMPIYAGAWDKVFKVNAQIERIETSSQFAQIVAPNEPVALVTMEMKVGDESGLFSVCLPHSSVEPMAKMLNTRLAYAGSLITHQSEEQAEVLTERMKRTKVNLTAYFADTPATVVDIANLQIGDVIRLNQRTDQPLKIKIQHMPKFHAKIGSSGNNYAVQIVDIITEGEEEDEPISGRN